MSRTYSNIFKKKLASMIVDGHESTIRTAEKFGVPLNTLEKWITSYRKNPEYFDRCDNQYQTYRYSQAHKYDQLTKEELIHECKLRDTKIEYLTSLLVAHEICIDEG